MISCQAGRAPAVRTCPAVPSQRAAAVRGTVLASARMSRRASLAPRGNHEIGPGRKSCTARRTGGGSARLRPETRPHVASSGVGPALRARPDRLQWRVSFAPFCARRSSPDSLSCPFSERTPSTTKCNTSAEFRALPLSMRGSPWAGATKTPKECWGDGNGGLSEREVRSSKPLRGRHHNNRTQFDFGAPPSAISFRV